MSEREERERQAGYKQGIAQHRTFTEQEAIEYDEETEDKEAKQHRKLSKLEERRKYIRSKRETTQHNTRSKREAAQTHTRPKSRKPRGAYRFTSRFHSKFDGQTAWHQQQQQQQQQHDILSLLQQSTHAPAVKTVTGFNVPVTTRHSFTLSARHTTPSTAPSTGPSTGTSTAHLPSSTASSNAHEGGHGEVSTNSPTTTPSTTTSAATTTTTTTTPAPTSASTSTTTAKPTTKPTTTTTTTTTPKPTTTTTRATTTTTQPTTTTTTATTTTTTPATTTTTTLPPVVNGCTRGDIAYKGSCYNLPGLQESWQGAKGACEAQDAHLVTLNDRFESAFLSSYLGELGDRSWLGMFGTFDNTSESITFTWVNNEPVTFTNWDEYEPDPTHGTCVAASGRADNPGLWSVWTCDDAMQYICEYERQGYVPVTKPPTTLPPPICAEGWDHHGDRCYKVFVDHHTWGRAEDTCHTYGAHLASVSSADEEATLMSLPGLVDLDHNAVHVWMGLIKGAESGYEWVDGTPLDYLNWEDGEPDSHHGREDCGQALRSNFQWSDAVCDTYNPYICEAQQGTMVTTMAPPTQTPDVPCQDDPTWLLYGDYCYKIVSQSDDQPNTWWESHRLCNQIGGELASIHTFEENYWLLSKVYNRSDMTYWLGGRSKIGGQFEWLDGSGFDFVNWAKGEPNDYLDQEDCIAMYNQHNGGYWNDQNCGHTEARICKRPHFATVPPPSSTHAPDGHCEKDWVHVGSKCVKVFPQRKVFVDARLACRDQGADLVSIHSPEEQAYLTAVLGSLQKEAWIGLRNDQGFHWMDQTAVTYTNWAPGEPNGFEMGEDCVHARKEDGTWNDIPCKESFAYVCMKPQDPSVATHTPPKACAEPFSAYMNYSGGCYRVFTEPKKWQAAEDKCAKDGAHLVSVQGSAESAFVWVLMQEYGVQEVWIGLNNIKEKDQYVWSDGWPTIFTNWASGQPNVSQQEHSCVAATRAHQGMWVNEACTDPQKPYICKHTDESVPTPDPPSTGVCPDNRWLDFKGGYCYLVVQEPKPWNEANMNCLMEDSQLVSIHSQEEMYLLTKATHQYVDPLWIGLVQKTAGYGWSDGTGLDYINWQNGEPNSVTEQCVEFYTGTGFWNDGQCSNTRTFVCKTKKIQHGEHTNGPPQHSTWRPDSNHNSGGLNAGGIVGIVIGVLFVVAAVGFLGYSYLQRRPPPVSGNGMYSFDNALYSERYDNGGQVRLESQADGTDA